MSNLSHMKHLGVYPQPQATITPSNLPYCLTQQYQDIVSKIHTSDDPFRGIGKTTGIWDETNRCKD